MGDREQQLAVDVLTRHLEKLTSDLESVLQGGARGRYGPSTVMEAIAATVAHIAGLESGRADEENR